jgi:hypothetical protein
MVTTKVRKVVLFVALLAALSTYFLTDSYVKKIQGQVAAVFQVNLSVHKTIYRFNTSFLRARRSEKNLIIFKDQKYREELDSFLNDTQRYYIELEHLISKPGDRELLYPLKKNIQDYKELVNKLYVSLFGERISDEEAKKLSLSIRDLNDALADNIMYLSDKTESDIQSLLVKIESGFAGLRSLPAIILVISVVVLLMVSVYGVRYHKHPSL